jgi:photosystem II stability/assembly factor-like uncharacterized protein
MQNHRRHKTWRAVIFLFLAVSLARLAPAQTGSQADGKTPAEAKAFERLEWRSIGPSNMGGRAADVEGVPGNPSLVYAATGSGGLWKTTNGGVTWKPIFERQNTISIGDIALEPNNPDVIWVGTGESNVRNSVSFGDGVYKSNDGGKTWQHLGLKDTNTISRIVVHPTNPNVAYVAAVGHPFGANEERGVFMTTDGGKTWQKTLYIDASHGASDLEIDPVNPNILYAGMWTFERKPWTFRSGDEKGGLFRSLDGGRTWNKITNGLPKLLGRIGVRVAPSNPNVVYAIVEAKEGTLYRSDDKGENFKQVSKDQNIVGRGFYYTRVRVDPTNENRVYAIASPLFLSIDGGRTFRTISGRTHVDFHALWIDPKNPSRIWQGQDGGFAVSNDSGETWEYVNNFAIGQFYQISADNRQPFYYISGGLQDNGTWTGPSRTREPAGIMNEDWRMVSFGDGFYALSHADDPELYLTESQGGSVVRTDFRNREQQVTTPHPQAGGGAAAEDRYRFNWNSPLVASPHDKNTVYLGGNVIFKSTDFGKTWAKISNDLTTNNKERQKEAGGPVAHENSSAEYYCTIISIAESPARAGVIWAGTDDGNLQLTTDGGKSWANLIKNIQGVPADSSVSHVEPSRANAGSAYVTFDRHKLDDYRPFVFKTSDGGQTWVNITGDLPAKAYVHVVREDTKNPNLLYTGTELGLFGSYNGGKNWVSLGLKNLPMVAVHDILIHPRDNDLIVATHGRSIWVFDDATPIQQMSAGVLNSEAQMFDIRPAIRFTSRFTRYGMGDAIFTGANPPGGALITYYLKSKPDEKVKVKIEVLDASGKLIRELDQIPKEQGLNRAAWDLKYGGPRIRKPPTEEETLFTGGPRGSQVLPGTYTVKLMVGDKSFQKQVEVRLDPTVTVSTADLQLLHDMTLKLRDMQTATNDSLRLLDSVKIQLEQAEKTIKDRMPDVPADLTKAIADYKKQVDTLMNTLARPDDEAGLGGGMRFSDRLGNLFFEMDSVNAAPTPAQREYFAELQTEFPQKVGAVNKFITETIPKMNETLRRFNGPTIMSGKPIELPR